MFNSFIEKKFLNEKKNFENKISETFFLNYAKIKSVLLLFDIKNDKNIGIFEHLANILEQDGKKVTLCAFVEQKKSMLEDKNNRIIIKKEDVSLWQKPKKELLNKISEQNFDAIFLLSTQKTIAVLYALMYANAKIRCGGIETFNLLNFIIDTSNTQFADETCIFDNIVRYLKIINKN